MKSIISGVAIAVLSITACNNNSNESKKGQNNSNDTTQPALQANITATKDTGLIKEIVGGYLQLKNGLASDNGNDAANGGKAIVTAIGKFDKTALSASQKKVYGDLAGDIKENAEHISENSSKLAHQREYFDMLSQDIYQLVKTFGSSQTLYYEHCPMYNDNKGADWLSETKEIKNPYLGKKMSDCGSLKEEIK